MCVCVYSEEEYELLLSIWNELELEWDKERRVTREVTHNFASAKHFKSSRLLSQALEWRAGLNGGRKEHRLLHQ